MIVDTIWTEEPGIQLLIDRNEGGWVELRYLEVDGSARPGRLLSSFMVAPFRVIRLIRALNSCLESPPPSNPEP